MSIIIFFLFGLFIGSFLNVLIYRLPREQQWIQGRSHCPHCHHLLAWYDLIPLFSWLLLKGHCRHCNKIISWQYPAIELTNALLWSTVGFLAIHSTSEVYSYLNLGISGWQLINTILLLVLTSLLLTILVIDFQHYIIPDQLVISLTIIGVVYTILDIYQLSVLHPSLVLFTIWQRLSWGLGAFLFFYFLHFITKGKGMGFGDVKLVFALGLILKSSVIVALMSAFLLGSIIGVGLLATKIKKLKQPIPFGPFLVIGSLIGLVSGQQVIEWYLGNLIL